MFYNRFRRTTSDGTYIPEIDGLRFIAIWTVVLTHIFHLIAIKNNLSFNHFLWTPIAIGGQGVQLFFVISGYILAKPFFLKSKNVNLKKYFMRRITRLEPPYILAMTLFFFILIFLNKYQFMDLIDNYFFSILYMHNIVYGKGSDINTVAWSLEVEIQFYILMPILALFLKKAGKYQLITLVLLIIVFITSSQIFDFYYRTIFAQIQYFMIGIVLVLLKQDPIFRINKYIDILVGGVSLVVILFLNRELGIFNELIFCFFIFAFYFIVLNGVIWKKVMSLPLFSLIGGMCYSIYLLHYPIVSFVGTYLINVSNKYNLIQSVSLLSIFAITSLIVLFISSIYFLFVEKPCMDPLWVEKIKSKIKI